MTGTRLLIGALFAIATGAYAQVPGIRLELLPGQLVEAGATVIDIDPGPDAPEIVRLTRSIGSRCCFRKTLSICAT